MKSLTLACLLVIFGVAMAKPQKYTDRYDNVNLDEILSNRRLLIPYIKCILDQGRCSPDAHIRDALENNCSKCTEVQRNGTRRVIGHLINNEVDYWNQLTAKYDPTHQFTRKYENELRQVKH